MTIKTNQELIQAVNQAIKDSGIKKTALAQKVGLSRQGMNNLLKKQSFSLDDANKILGIINMEVTAEMRQTE
ncbi:helix-turn-helix domain-containing protein [Lacrimispora indolis]|uniref:helix-turn-helix domain-containing protein n=1 Tax=Lacrimispora indolis TaxID=69825 RepID=UPI0003FC4598|nr:helix-turn-helix domain-containing protein [[Clostridium] methoxybenzovorans]